MKSAAICTEMARLVSPPTRRCGLKLRQTLHIFARDGVTSYAEVWIEITKNVLIACDALVTSYAEVWIEMRN